MRFCPIVFGRHLQLGDMALAPGDVAGRAVELDWAITKVPVGHDDILKVWGAQQGPDLKGEEG